VTCERCALPAVVTWDGHDLCRLHFEQLNRLYPERPAGDPPVDAQVEVTASTATGMATAHDPSS
jgi:hypothetical protein